MLIVGLIAISQVPIIMSLIASSAQLMHFHNKKLLLHLNLSFIFMPHSHEFSLKILAPIFFYPNRVL
jgi:hypothetical protein